MFPSNKMSQLKLSILIAYVDGQLLIEENSKFLPCLEIIYALHSSLYGIQLELAIRYNYSELSSIKYANKVKCKCQYEKVRHLCIETE